MLMGISGHFIDERKPLGVMKTRDNELRFPVNPRRVSATGERVQPFAGPVAILVDALSGSARSVSPGACSRSGGARFRSAQHGPGAAGAVHRLPNGDVLIHAYGDFVTADGTRLEGRGVVPDEPVALDRATCWLAGIGLRGGAGLVRQPRSTQNRAEPLTIQYCAGIGRLLHSGHLRELVFQPHHTGISGSSEWSSAGCVWATFSTITVHVSAASPTTRLSP